MEARSASASAWARARSPDAMGEEFADLGYEMCTVNGGRGYIYIAVEMAGTREVKGGKEKFGKGGNDFQDMSLFRTN